MAKPAIITKETTGCLENERRKAAAPRRSGRPAGHLLPVRGSNRARADPTSLRRLVDADARRDKEDAGDFCLCRHLRENNHANDGAVAGKRVSMSAKVARGNRAMAS